MARNPVRRPQSKRPDPSPPRTVGARQTILGLILGALAVVAAVLWISRETDVQAERARPVPSPPATTQVSATVVTATEVTDAPPAFLDPAGAGALAYASGDRESALEQYRAAIAANPDDAEAHSNLGQVLVQLNRPAEAIAFFDRAITLIPDRWAYHFNRGRALGLLGQWGRSVESYARAQALFPDDHATTFNLAQALHRKGDEPAAVEQYLRAIDLSPEDASFRLALGISYERLQKAAEAAAAYSEYLRLAPDASDATKVRERIALLTGTS